MANIKDISNQKFNHLTAIEFHSKDKYGHYLWRCLCDCGNEKITHLGSLQNNLVKSCGCIKHIPSTKLPPGEAALRKLIGNIKSKALIVRNLEWKLSNEECIRLFTSNCTYCGVKPLQCSKTKSSEYYYNGIDRIDSSKGYITGNVTSCCGQCNRAKTNMSTDDFLKWIDRVYKNSKNLNYG